MSRSAADRNAANQASFTAALMKQHRAIERLLADARMVGPATWRFKEMTFGEVMAAHQEANKEPLMPRPRTAG
jgi:hypothetical protein